MPIVFEEKHGCEKCKRELEWIYFEQIRSKLESGLPIAEIIPTTQKAYRTETIADNTYRIYINCPKCGYENIFIYDKQ